jgi:hypothetical protein
MAAGPAPVARPLSEEVAAWRTEGGRPCSPDEMAHWQTATTGVALDGDNAEALSNLLGRLRVTAHYRVAPADLQGRVNTLLDGLFKSSEALQSCAAQAVEGTQACDDRIALAFFLMEENLIVRHAHQLSATSDAPAQLQTIAPAQLQTIARGLLDGLLQPSEALQSFAALAFFPMEENLIVRHAHELSATPGVPAQLQTIARGLYKSEVLRAIANHKVDEIKAQGGFIDETEIILKYWVQLSTELELPCKLQDMIFHNCARDVSDADINSARQQVRAAEADTPRFELYLAAWEPWRAMLEKRDPGKYAAAMDSVDKYKDVQSEKLDDFLREAEARKTTHGENDARYLELMHTIGKQPGEIRNFEIQEILRLSRELGVLRPPL